MKIFRTPLPATTSPHRIRMGDALLSAGSCFAEAIGKRLADHKMPILTSPFGAVYNPVSIHTNLTAALTAQPDFDDCAQNREIWHHYNYHSRFAAPSRQELLSGITKINEQVAEHLRRCSTLIVTYGTAWIFRRLETNRIVANCHKMPAAHFRRETLDVAAIVESFRELHDALIQINPGIHAVLTVSPVRHLKDSMEGNSLSKAILRTACHDIQKSFRNVSYFPAFEIMMDDLRDYRFYKSDMIHPTEDAEEYIWDCFVQQYADDDLKQFFEQWRQIQNALQHKPFHPRSSAHQEFLKNALRALEELKHKVDVDREMSLVKEQII